MSEIKRSIGGKIMNAIFRGDDYKTFATSVWEDQILPTIGDVLEDVCSRAIHAVFFDDESYSPSRRRRGRDRYRDYSRSSRKSRSRDRERRRSRDDEDDIPSDLGPRDIHLVPFDSLNDWDNCVRYLIDQCEENGYAEVRDLYSYKEIASTNFRNQDYGWDNVRDIKQARYKKRGGKYYMEITRPVKLDKEGDDDDDDYED